jgi:hypothetical protein
MGDGQTGGEEASDTCDWDGRVARLGMGRGAVGEGHGVTVDKRAVGEEARMNERPRCCVERRVDKDEQMVFVFLFLKVMGATRAAFG